MNKVTFPLNNKYFPFDTKKIFDNIKTSDNFYYLFNTPNIDERNGIKIRINDKLEIFKWDEDFIQSITNRIDISIRDSGLSCLSLKMKVAWRMVIGLGASHPQETSMTLHHIYGIPYIPGSAVKGVTRHWTILKFADETAKKERKDFYEVVKEIDNALEDGKDLGINCNEISFRDLINIFGTQEQAGKVIFMDAFPAEPPNLKIDIMNPHHPDYYSGNKPPADWQNPNPIKFLTVEETKFNFNLLSKDENLLNKTIKLLFNALSMHGIGAKTSLGYGIFKNKEVL